ncbi:ABC transporter substrate-binding protein [Chengkuizengella axinellae]|uniref:ABC transporter substrate-binding protein n=1 Tax=Chengkuizengella axinellae TaxID=3064388 RepID=A0ABT9J2E9_9BACL|nr:ABC transporter substrate-binding protein [Chengkuizengella sp. 2205SS18-9]MDP5275794.1 ABC transporter substrate-binding protein [Chengkuizengella sp. 2205SS18-9]
MNKRVIILLLLISILMIVLSGCGNQNQTEQTQTSSENLLETETDWETILKEAEGQTVNFHMWGGDERYNRYIDEFIAPKLKESTGVVLNRVAIQDTKDVMNKLNNEKSANKTDGTVDIIWINGENFKLAKENELLWGSFASQLPNVNQYVDINAPDIQFDFGQNTEGYEVPWGKAQFVFIYDESNITHPPTSFEELGEWMEENPGKFTYPAPPDFTGSAFVRQALYETTGGYEQYLEPVNDIEQDFTPLWNYLNEIEPNLWRNGETYPESLAKLDQLFSSGEVWMTMAYDPGKASSHIEQGLFPDTTRTFVLDGGTISNTHYLSIPYNSNHQAGAMVAINYLLSPEAQLAKMDPEHWGEGMALDPSKLDDVDQKKLEELDLGIATLPAEQLAEFKVPEIPANYVKVLEEGWFEYVAKR